MDFKVGDLVWFKNFSGTISKDFTYRIDKIKKSYGLQEIQISVYEIFVKNRPDVKIGQVCGWFDAINAVLVVSRGHHLTKIFK